MSGVRMLNIPRRKDDEFYRYKMPDLIHKVEGKGNGIKTVIVNCEDIAEALVRPASYIIRYFGNTFGAQVTADNGKYIVNGKHEYKDLMNVLDKFIDRFVLCRKCENPETVMIVKNKSLTLHCKACGEDTAVPKNEKLLKFIFAHPPKHDKDYAEEGDKEGEEEVKENPFEKRVIKITLKKRDGTVENIEILGKDFDLDKVLEETSPGNRFNAHLIGYKRCFDLSTKALLKELFEKVFTEKMFDEIVDNIDYFDHFLGDELNTAGMIAFLEEFNATCAKYKLYDDKKLANTLLYLYNNGYCIKEAILEWYEGGSVQMSQMKQKAKDFVDWLSEQDDEVEEEEEEEEEEYEEVEEEEEGEEEE